MKKFTLSIAAVMAMGTFAIAGGDIAPVEEPIVVVEPVVDDSGFYLGLAYSFVDTEVIWDYSKLEQDNYDGMEGDYHAIMLQVGYKFNSYFAVEGRYWNNVADGEFTHTFYNPDGSVHYEIEEEDGRYDFNAWGIYVKPMYPVTDSFDVYALLGYADTTITPPSGLEGTVNDKDGFSWGLGASYAFMDNLSVFADYASLYDDDALNENGYGEDMTIETWNFGLTYKF